MFETHCKAMSACLAAALMLLAACSAQSMKPSTIDYRPCVLVLKNETAGRVGIGFSNTCGVQLDVWFVCSNDYRPQLIKGLNTVKQGYNLRRLTSGTCGLPDPKEVPAVTVVAALPSAGQKIIHSDPSKYFNCITQAVCPPSSDMPVICLYNGCTEDLWVQWTCPNPELAPSSPYGLKLSGLAANNSPSYMGTYVTTCGKDPTNPVLISAVLPDADPDSEAL